MSFNSRLQRLEDVARKREPEYVDYEWYAKAVDTLPSMTDEQRVSFWMVCVAIAYEQEPEPEDIAALDATGLNWRELAERCPEAEWRRMLSEE